jgi:hypothetical protein
MKRLNDIGELFNNNKDLYRISREMEKNVGYYGKVGQLREKNIWIVDMRCL